MEGTPLRSCSTLGLDPTSDNSTRMPISSLKIISENVTKPVRINEQPKSEFKVGPI